MEKESPTTEPRRDESERREHAADGSRPTNRLASEASPYLLQHAHNPVAWWPWCDEALAEAKRRDVPILLSIGYSACHWCHVMERESFEDATTAASMNELFVNIKVDREERPDLDQIYQLVVQLMGRSGGWPLTVFLTPSQKPFFGGTYYPPEDRYGMPSFAKILRAIAEAYREKRDDVEDQAVELTRAIAEASRGEASASTPYAPGTDLLARATERLLSRFDAVNGGFGRAPKFPNTMPLELLLRRGVLEGDGKAAEAARLMLGAMRRGGIWDHLGGGFHRYSTDERWLVPHFEKMLYDNALLLRAYVDGARSERDPAEREVFVATARAIATYVAREMTDAEGGFYASQDADSEGEEGKFFVWDEESVAAALSSPAESAVAPEKGASTRDADASANDTALVVAAYGITAAGNFEDHGRPTFQTVLSEAKPLTALAASFGIGVDAVAARLAAASKRLFDARERRIAPFRDEKVLASWSALMVSSLAEAGAALDDDAILAAAVKAFAFLEAKLVSPVDHADEPRARVARLAKRVDGGQWLVKGPGFLDDHAFVANAALDLYEATGAPAYVVIARAIAEEIVASFASESDGFFFTPSYAETLIARSKDPYDNAIPSGSSIAARVFLRLGSLVDARFGAIAERELLALAPAAIANPLGFGQSLCELDRLVHGAVDVVLVGPRRDPRTIALARTVQARFVPNRTIAWLDPTDPSSRAACALLAEGKPAHEAPVAYVCRGRTCSLPVATPEALAPLLAPLRPSAQASSTPVSSAPSASAVSSAPSDPKAPR